jgi:putative component of toxin-antitoxin plasmid stabilization module
MASVEIRHYVTRDGRDVFLEWLYRLRDPIAKMRIVQRVNRIELANRVASRRW